MTLYLLRLETGNQIAIASLLTLLCSRHKRYGLTPLSKANVTILVNDHAAFLYIRTQFLIHNSVVLLLGILNRSVVLLHAGERVDEISQHILLVQSPCREKAHTCRTVGVTFLEAELHLSCHHFRMILEIFVVIKR